jgi:siroheme synthase-like protein
MFPLVVDLTDRPVVVIGAGKVGVHKAAQLLEAGALVTVITDVVLAPVPDGVAALHLRSYRYGDLEGALLVVAATGDPDVNDRIVAEANERNILLNVVDDLSRSNFYFTAVHRDGDVIVSVSTGGSSPALAQWVRNTVAKALPRNLASVARALRAERSALHDAGESTENREWMQRVNQLVDEF